MTTDAIITFENVGVVLGEDPIYDQLSFDVRPGEFVCILGPSGCGKSTSLRLIGGLLPADDGTITVDGSAPGNVMLGGDLRFGSAGRAERRARAQALLELVGLARDTAKYPIMLSGG